MNYETVDHKLFECSEIDNQSREKLVDQIKSAGINPPHNIRDIIATSVINMKISVLDQIGELIKINNIHI